MGPRRREAKRLFLQCVDLAPDARVQLLLSACNGDAKLLADVESLLGAHSRAGAFLQGPPRVAFLASSTDEDTLVGQRIDAYRVAQLIGQGGMGRVYLAHRDDGEFDHSVAIKTIDPFGTNPEIHRRFKIERQILAGVGHPNIARLLGGGTTDAGTPYFLMEYIEGKPLDRYCDELRLPIKERVRLLRTVCEAVQACHDHAVVHRDIKPGNILVTGSGVPKLLDFGIAKILSPHRVDQTVDPTCFEHRVMTPAFASPEQLRGEPIGPASDVYSLGVLSHLLLTGRLPCEAVGAVPGPGMGIAGPGIRPSRTVVRTPGSNADGPTANEIAAARGATPRALRRQLAGPLDRIVLQALRSERRHRYRSAEAMTADLGRYMSGHRVLATRDAVSLRARRALARRPLASGAMSATIGLALLWAATNAMRTPPFEPVILTHMEHLTSAVGMEVDPALSPDGMRFAYASGPAGAMHVYVQESATNTRIRISSGLDGDHRWPQWSSKGDRLLFQSRNVEGFRLWNASSDGKGAPVLVATFQSRLAQNEGPSASWSPDGRRIAYVDGAVYVRELPDGVASRIAEAHEPHSLRWSPDGERISFVSGNAAFLFGSVLMGNAAGSSIRIVTIRDHVQIHITDARYFNASPVWMPDGDSLLFISNRDGVRDIYQQPITPNGSPRGAPLRVTTGLHAQALDTPRVGRLAFTVYDSESSIRSLDIPDLDPISIGDAKPLVKGNFVIEGLDVTQDGRWLVYDSNRHGNQDIFKMSLAGGAEIRLTSDTSDDMLPVWSPDGEKVAFYSLRDGNREIYVMNADGTGIERLTNHPAIDRFPDWAPNGNRLVFDSDRSGRYELYVISRSNRSAGWGEPQQLTFGGGQSAYWSPVGGLIAYTTDRGHAKVPRLLLVSLDGRPPRTLLGDASQSRPAAGGAVQWSPDGMRLYVAAGGVWEVPISGGPARLLLLPDPSVQMQRMAVGAGRLLFIVTGRESDMYTMDYRSRAKQQPLDDSAANARPF